MIRVLVTGGNGFIGSHLVNSMAACTEYRVTVFDLYPRPYDPLPDGVAFVQGNLNDTELVRRTLEDNAIEVVYHVAWAGIHETALRNPLADIQNNLIATVNLLEACLAARVKRVVFMSSGGTVYGRPRSMPIKEDHPADPINAYGVTKLAVEKYLKMYSYLKGLEYVIFRPSVPYGPRQNPHRRQGAVTVFIYSALRRKPVTIWGDGKVSRAYFFVEDMVSALLAGSEIPFQCDSTFNLDGMQEYTLNQLVDVIEQTLGLQLQVRYEKGRIFDVPALRLDIAAAATHLGWRPQTSLEEGIVRTAAWIERWID